MLEIHGFEVIVFATAKNETLFKDVFKEGTNITVVVLNNKSLLKYLCIRPYLLLSSLNKKKMARNILKNFRLHSINQYSPDIIHFEFSGIAIDYLNIFKDLKGKKVVSCRGSAEKVKLLLYEERKQHLRLLLTKTDAIHCVSGDMRTTILPYCNTPVKIFINYPSINTDFFRRAQNNITNETPVILSVGRLTFQKGYFTGLQAIRQLKQAGTAFTWLIVGNGTQYEELLFHINRLGLEQSVKVFPLKTKAEIRHLMEQATVFFLPSVYEGIANVVLEAMSMELPVVSTRCGGMAEVITHGHNGLLAEVYDHEQLARHITYLIHHPAAAAAMGNAARMRVEEQFTLERQTAVFETIYEQLLTD